MGPCAHSFQFPAIQPRNRLLSMDKQLRRGHFRLHRSGERRRRIYPSRPVTLRHDTFHACKIYGPCRFEHQVVASFFAERFIVGGIELSRRNVTTPLVSSLAGGRDLCRIEVARLRATWLATAAEAIGLKAFMDAAGIYCSQRLGDLVASLPAAPEDKAVALLGGSR